MANNKYLFLVDGILKGMNRGVCPLQYIQLSGYDSPEDILRKISRSISNRHSQLDQKAIDSISYNVLMMAGLLIHSEKFKAEFLHLRRSGITDSQIKEKLGISRNAFERARRLFESHIKFGDDEPAEEPKKLINGLEYKIGAHGFVYYKSGSDWLRSSRTSKELRL